MRGVSGRAQPGPVSAAGRVRQHTADFGHSHGAKRGDVFCEVSLLRQERIADIEHTVGRHAVSDTDVDLGVPTPNRPGGGYRDHIELPVDVIIASDDQSRSALVVGPLVQPNLSTSHLGLSYPQAWEIVSPNSAISSSSRRCIKSLAAPSSWISRSPHSSRVSSVPFASREAMNSTTGSISDSGSSSSSWWAFSRVVMPPSLAHSTYATTSVKET